MKTCTLCLKNKTLDLFPLDYRKEGRRKARCFDCVRKDARIRAKDYFAKNKEARRAYERKRYYTKSYRAHKKTYCEKCSFIAEHSCQLDVDHIDGNHKNNNPSNLQTLCSNCHRLKTHKKGDNHKWAKDPVVYVNSKPSRSAG